MGCRLATMSSRNDCRRSVCRRRWALSAVMTIFRQIRDLELATRSHETRGGGSVNVDRASGLCRDLLTGVYCPHDVSKDLDGKAALPAQPAPQVDAPLQPAGRGLPAMQVLWQRPLRRRTRRSEHDELRRRHGRLIVVDGRLWMLTASEGCDPHGGHAGTGDPFERSPRRKAQSWLPGP